MSFHEDINYILRGEIRHKLREKSRTQTCSNVKETCKIQHLRLFSFSVNTAYQIS